MRPIAIISLFCIISSAVYAQKDCGCEHLCDCKISGRVYDLETKEPLPLASIIQTTTGKGVSADASGNFTLKNICECRFLLEISYTGYQTKTVTVHADHPEFLNIFLAPDAKMLESVIILGKMEDNVLVSQVSKVVGEDKIEKSTGAALGEVLSNISGVASIETGSNVVKPVLHGLSSNRILILNNGLRFEGQQWGAEHAPAIDPLLARNIEVVKGASSVRYGTGAIGGVILVLPPDLPESKGLSGKLNLSAQTNGGIFTSSAMVEGLSENLAGLGWRAQATFKRGGDLKAPDYNLTNTGVKEINFSLAAGKKKEKFEYEFFTSHFSTTLGILKATGLSENMDDLIQAIKSPEPQSTGRFSYHIGNPRQEVAHTLVKAKTVWKISENELALQYGFQNNQRKEYDIRRGSLSQIPSMDLSLNTHLLDGDLQLAGGGKHSVNAGFNSYYQQNNNIAGTQTIPFIPNYTLASAGIYIIDHYKWGKATVEGGIRADYQHLDVAGRDSRNEVFHSNFDFTSISGIAGLRLPVNARDFITVNVASGWRPPHVSELYSFGTHQSAAAIEYGILLDENNSVIDADNISIKNEESLKAVLGYDHHGQQLHFDVSGYYHVINNYFYLKPEGFTTNTRGSFPAFRQRQTKALFSGVDVEVEYDANELVTLTGAYSWLYAKDLGNDDYFLYIPPSRMRGGITLHWERKPLIDHLDVFLNGEYVFRQNRAPAYVDPEHLENTEIPAGNFDFIPAPDGYFLLESGVSVTKRWAKNFMEWRITATNLLNNNYRSYTNRLKYFADDRGRNINFGITYHF